MQFRPKVFGVGCRWNEWYEFRRLNVDVFAVVCRSRLFATFVLYHASANGSRGFARTGSAGAGTRTAERAKGGNGGAGASDTGGDFAAVLRHVSGLNCKILL